MNRLFLVLFFTLLSLGQAKMVDGIALIVEGEPITTAEIHALRTNLHLSKDKAIDLLIQDRLQKIAMKDIIVAEEEVDNKIAQIAKENHISIPKMQKILKQQGTPWVTYRQSITEGLRKAHFYQEVIIPSIPEPSEDTLKLYYNEHHREFKIPKRISMIEYSAKTHKALESFLKKRKAPSIQKRKIRKNTSDLDLEMLSMFLQTPKNRYTKILNAGEKYIVYKIIDTYGKRIMPFEMAQVAAIAKWKQSQQAQTLNDYFQKFRARSSIQTLR